jgi:tetratricopeptide (TPR) repeat protein
MRKFRLGLLTAVAGATIFYSSMFFLARAEGLNEADRDMANAYIAPTEDGIALYSKQIELHPKNYVLYLRRAVALNHQRDYEGALEDLNHAAKLSPNKLTAEKLGDKRWDSSVPETHAWQLDMQIHVMRASVLERLNRFDEALRDLNYVVKLDPQHVANRHARGVVLTLLGQYDKAIEDFDTVLARRMIVDSLFARGISKFLKEDWIGSREDFTHASKLAPHNAKVVEWLKRAEIVVRAQGIYTASAEVPTLGRYDVSAAG